MITPHSLTQEQWVGLNYGLLLLALPLPLLVLWTWFATRALLDRPQDVWVRSHLLWIMRSSAGFFALMLLILVLLIPLYWMPPQQGIGLILLVLAGSVAGLGGL